MTGGKWDKALRELAEELYISARMHKLERDLRERLEPLLKAAEGILERIDINGGIGEYKGGPPFIVKQLREEISKWKT